MVSTWPALMPLITSLYKAKPLAPKSVVLLIEPRVTPKVS